MHEKFVRGEGETNFDREGRREQFSPKNRRTREGQALEINPRN